ncbi:MAG: molybdopterin-guanine dinucleotide biosynthesis protein MobB [Candidatus Syntrophosphaera sp.]|nr:molybdopterin-guanine dinucleotide biosynthesis protein MobB [Candidatus Syntrophosphaera sp.]
MKALGIIGYHHTGKTTLATQLISALSGQGFKVASIKDIHNENYHADSEGSNSWKHARAGATQVFARGLHDAALILTPAPELTNMLALLQADWLVIEGLKSAAVPKIICADTTEQVDELIDDTVFALSGRISDQMDSYRGLPVFCLQRSAPQLLEAILQKSFAILPQSDPACCSACGRSCWQLAADIVQGRATRDDCVLDGQNSLVLEVGGKQATIVPFVQNLLRDCVLAFVDNLKGIDSRGDISIQIKR